MLRSPGLNTIAMGLRLCPVNRAPVELTVSNRGWGGVARGWEWEEDEAEGLLGCCDVKETRG